MMFGCVKKCLRGFFTVDGRNFQVEVNISKELLICVEYLLKEDIFQLFSCCLGVASTLSKSYFVIDKILGGKISDEGSISQV